MTAGVRRLLLDTSSLFYRAYFALPVSILGNDGMPVNALRGYLDMTAQLLREQRPDEVIHCYDAEWRPPARVAAHDGYKAVRATQTEPESLPEQIAVLRTVLDLLGAVQAEAPGWEADDAIATLAEHSGPHDQVDVVTGDRDLLQLVRDGERPVRVLFTLKGVSQLATFDEAAVLDKYGIPAARYADFATLRGDPSDGLPGVKGVGEKTARDLVRAFPSLPALVEAAQSLPPGGTVPGLPGAVAAKVRSAVDYLDAMAAVVPVRRDVEVVVRRPTADLDAVVALAERHRIEGPVERLVAALP